MKPTKKEVFEQINKKWYRQGFNCTPLLLGPCGSSGMDLKPTLGDTMRSFLYEFKNDYGLACYSSEDLDRLGAVILGKIRSERDFLKNVRKEYERTFKTALGEITPSIRSLSSFSDKELIQLLAKSVATIRLSVGQAHIIEPFALTTDHFIKEKLRNYIKDEKKLNLCLSALSQPIKKSFINESEEELYALSLIKGKDKRARAITIYLKRFFWIRNSYAGRVKRTVSDIEKELESLGNFQPLDTVKIKKEKREIIKELKLDTDLILLLETSDFMTEWQDKRKKNILTAIDPMEAVLEELASRLSIDVSLLRYLSEYELDENLLTNKKLKATLQERRKGCIYFTAGNGFIFLTGEDYARFHKQVGDADKQFSEAKDIHGLTASSGTAVGKVMICKSIQDISHFVRGSVLVASMTRPEYLPAMKKAVAIVTDEGGITSHAAIISRELGIPCIIGTKNATKILKDGMLVEVKANHGLVRIL